MSSSSFIVYCHTSTKCLGKEIANTAGSLQIAFHNDVMWNKFPDGYPNLFIQDIHRCVGKHVIFLGSFDSPEVVFEQISLLYALPRCSVRSLTFILPYFPTGTMERVDTEGQIATAATMARILSSTPLSSMGPTRLMIFDIHALQERFYFTDNIIPLLCSTMPHFLGVLSKYQEDNGPVSIAFPDPGAHKRFSSYFQGYPTIRCIKVRHNDERQISIIDGEPAGKNVVIVDDLIMTGNTIKKCIEELRNKGAAKISVYVAHAVFPKDSWKSFVNDDLPGGPALDKRLSLDTFWITNSLPHAREIARHAPFKLLSLAESIVQELERLNIGAN